jgi:hypothetical protein
MVVNLVIILILVFYVFFYKTTTEHYQKFKELSIPSENSSKSKTNKYVYYNGKGLKLVKIQSLRKIGLIFMKR